MTGLTCPAVLILWVCFQHYVLSAWLVEAGWKVEPSSIWHDPPRGSNISVPYLIRRPRGATGRRWACLHGRRLLELARRSHHPRRLVRSRLRMQKSCPVDEHDAVLASSVHNHITRRQALERIWQRVGSGNPNRPVSAVGPHPITSPTVGDDSYVDRSLPPNPVPSPRPRLRELSTDEGHLGEHIY